MLMQVKVITPEGVVLDQQAEVVTLPGAAGDLQVLPGHRPLAAALRAGSVVLGQANARATLVIAGGVASVRGDMCEVLALESTAATTVDRQACAAEVARLTAHLAEQPLAAAEPERRRLAYYEAQLDAHKA